MKKLKSFSVKSMASLSREELARLTGGDFTVYDCKEGNDGKYCAISFSGDTVTLGICKVYCTTTVDGFKYDYRCVSKSSN